MSRSLRAFLAAVALVATGSAAVSAQSPEEILARFTKAVDPSGKLASIQGMRTSVTMEMAAAGITANITAVQRRPNQMSVTMEIPGLGEMRQGFDGTTAWSSDPMQGPRILSGPEASAMADGATFDAMARRPDQFSAMEAAGEVEVDGDKASCLRLTWKSGRITTECFSLTTGLLVETRQTQQSQMGEIEAVSRPSDYRDVGGIKVPHKVTNSAMGMQQVMTTKSVEFGPQDPALFELPPEIKALKDK